jgi:hypothetical protein
VCRELLFDVTRRAIERARSLNVAFTNRAGENANMCFQPLAKLPFIGCQRRQRTSMRAAGQANHVFEIYSRTMRRDERASTGVA